MSYLLDIVEREYYGEIFSPFVNYHDACFWLRKAMLELEKSCTFTAPFCKHFRDGTRWGLKQVILVCIRTNADLVHIGSADTFLESARQELDSARSLFPNMQTLAEAWCVIKEEVDECWAEANKWGKTDFDPNSLYNEIVQIVAMCVRCDEDVLEASE